MKILVETAPEDFKVEHVTVALDQVHYKDKHEFNTQVVEMLHWDVINAHENAKKFKYALRKVEKQLR